MNMIIFSFLSKKEDFLQFLPKSNKSLFTIIDILNFMQKMELPHINQENFYLFITKMVENKYIEKSKDKFSLVIKNIENYLAHTDLEYSNGLLSNNQKDQEDPKVKERALLILEKKEREYRFVNSEVFEKSRQLINEFDDMGNLPEIVAFVAFFQANRILNKNFHINRNIFNFSNRDYALIRYWNKKFENKYSKNLFDVEQGKTFLHSIKQIGSYELTEEFKKIVLSLLDSPIKLRFGLNVRLTLGLSILLAANLKEIPIEDRDVSKSLQLDPGELVINSFKLLKRPNQYDISKFYKKNPSLIDLINSNLIREGDHLTFDLNNPPTEDAEILDYNHLKYHEIKLTRKEWAYKVKNIKNCNFTSNNYIFHRETGLSLKSLLELISL